MTLTYKVHKPPGLVFDYLTNMSKFVSVHPVINNMAYLGENKYQVFETLKFGLFPFSFAYPASLEIYYETRQVIMTATVMKSNTIKMIFDIKEARGCAVIKEVISFKTKLPVKLILGQIFRKQHARLFKNIENLIVEI